MIYIPNWGTSIRLLLIAVAGMIFFWLGLEDHTLFWIALLSFACTALILAQRFFLQFGGRFIEKRQFTHSIILNGIVQGVFANVFLVGAMFFKTAWHGHAQPDFPFMMMVATLAQIPIWLLGSLSITIGIILLAYSTSDAGSS